MSTNPVIPMSPAPELQEFLREGVPDSGEPQSLRSWLDLAEAWKITQTLRECRGNRSAAARSLGIGRRTLYAKMEKLEITPAWGSGAAHRAVTDLATGQQRR